MGTQFDMLCDVLPGRDSWKFQVRVLRLWPVYSFLKPEEITIVRKQLVYRFEKKIIEGNVYKLSHFAITPSVGGYRPTLHPYRLIFEMETRVQLYEGPDIPSFGFSFTDLDVLSSYDADVGFLLGVSSEREYVRDGKVIKMIVLELTDPRPSFKDDFLNLYPKKTIKELESLMEEGTFVVCAVIDGFADVALSNWWYPACKWHRSVTLDSGAHYCKGCDKHVCVTIPRFRGKANVFDGETNVVFVIFDGDMQYLIQKECPSLVVSGENRGIYPAEFEDLKGVKFLIKSNVVSHIKEIKKIVSSPTRVNAFAPGLSESSEALKFADENLVTPDCDVVDNSTDDCSFDVIVADDDDSDINVGMSAVKRKSQEGQCWTFKEELK
ncbi:hypothetical protein TSUD_375850 [Trifolium subterraneum]|uniref:Replication protein A 70 kDa DNA-binding subunit B/D first OB fold domain-containing protein n=1 Tax=Trifolium subterraneum TaxID=3900 RepID=A0A2Z6MJ46_TRISU|nr:hypothetical protein TSUD_375850 [Trifolium subterraneum]